MIKHIRLTISVFMVLIVNTLFISCVSSKKAIYFNDVRDTTFTSVRENLQPVILKNDLLSINVSSLNPEATVIFNMPNLATISASTNTGTTTQTTGYLVDLDGNIQFPVIGKVSAAGSTKKQLEEYITKSLVEKKLLIDPIVNIRFLNFRVTVLGEVARPTVVTVANEKISILEAIGLAGDLTIFAKRNNVMVIREESGEKIVKRLNLNSSDIFTSPYYYLKSNDIVYVEPNETKIASTSNTRQLMPLILSALSVIAIAIDRLLQ